MCNVSVASRKHCFLDVTSGPYNPSNPSSMKIPEPEGQGCNADVPFRTENAEISYSLPVDQVRFSVLIAIYKKLL